MIRYLASLAVFLGGIVSTIFVSGSTLWYYIDIPSLIIVGILPFLFVSIIFGYREMVSAFSVLSRKETEREKLIKAYDFFKMYGKVTWIMGFIAVIVGVVAILANLEDKTALGPNLALALISMMYSGIINAVIVIPFSVIIKNQLKE
jgi:flagellar motor component MotA